MRIFLLCFLTSVVGCIDDRPEPGTTSAQLVSTAVDTTADMAASPLDLAAAGTACGPNGLVCSANETCCATGPLPPAGVRYVCLKQGQVCNP